MTSPVNSPKAPLPPLSSHSNSKPATPSGVADAPTVLESAEAPKDKKAEKMEPGVFETLITGLIHFIILLFTPLWNGLFGKRGEPEQAPTQNPPAAS